MKKNFGIIGLGVIANTHAAAIDAIDGAELVACLDVNMERADSFGREFVCTAYTNIDEFLAHDGLEIVNICTPSGLHLDGAVAAARAGKHLIIEKPLEVTIERCDKIIKAAEENRVLLSGIFPSRFHAAARIVKKTVDSGRLGKIVLADAYVKWFRTQEYYDSSGWRGTWKLDGGGALMNQSIHAVDLLQWFMGPVLTIASQIGTVAHERIEVEDSAVAALRFENGALGVIEGSTGAYPGFLKRIELSGSRGTIVLEEESITVWDFQEKLAEDDEIIFKYAKNNKSAGGASDPAAIGFHGHQLQIENMIRGLEQGEPLLVDGHEARKAVEIIEAIYRSSRQSGFLNLPLDQASLNNRNELGQGK